MEKTVLFIHSAGPQGPNQGSSNLIKYLENEIDGKYQFIHPEMPNPEEPKYKPWRNQLEEEFHKLEGDVILVGHSLGGSVLLKYLSEEKCNVSISALFILASPYWGLDKDWQLEEFNLRSNFAEQLPPIKKLFLYHSRDEEVVPFTHHEEYSKKLLNAMTRVLEGKQHLFHNGLPGLVADLKSS